MKSKKSKHNTEERKLVTNGPNGGEPAFEEVATCAYLIWEQEGRPAGRDMQHWLEAERQLAATQE
jgi:Protein of unknown function (DUF2934)